MSPVYSINIREPELCSKKTCIPVHSVEAPHLSQNEMGQPLKLNSRSSAQSLINGFSLPTDFYVRYIEGQAPVVQRADSANHWINHYSADKCYQNKLSYPVDSDLFRWIVLSTL